MNRLKDLLQKPLDNNTYLVNAESQSGWMPVGGLALSMMPDEFQKQWSDILESSVEKITNDGAYGKEIYLIVADDKRLQGFPFAILQFYGQEQKNDAISDSRKANLFDSLIESISEPTPSDNWYDIFREIGMSNEEMLSMGLDLPELKVTQKAVEDMAEYVVRQIMNKEMGETQTHITISLDELASRFGVDLESCELAEEMFIQELYNREEIADAECTRGDLWIKPDESILAQLRATPQPTMGM